MPFTGSSGDYVRLESAKLLLVREEIGKRKPGLVANGHTSSGQTQGPGGNVSSGEFAELLFRKAPEDYLNSNSVETLAIISEDCEAAYREHLGGRSIVVRVNNNPEGAERSTVATIITAVEDQPFIIDSLNELFRCESLPYSIMLHPIISGEDGKKVSVVYVELPKFEDQQKANNIKSEVESILNNLSIVKHDTPSMLVHVETVARMVELGMGTDEVSEADRIETSHFLRWLADGFFVFLGYQEYIHNPSADKDKPLKSQLQLVDANNLGLCNTKDELFRQRLGAIEDDVYFAVEHNRPIFVSKLLVQSPVHRRTWLDVVTVRCSSMNQQTHRYCCFLGVFSSNAITQEASATPVLRRKLWKVIESEGVVVNSFDHKEIVALANGLPKSELFLYDLPALHNRIWLIMSMQRRNEVRVAYDVGPLSRIVSVMIAMPRARYTDSVRDKVQRHVEKAIGANPGSSEFRISVSDSPLIILHLSVPNQSGRSVAIDPEVLTKEIRELTYTWDDNVLFILRNRFGVDRMREFQTLFVNRFVDSYKTSVSPESAIRDIEMLSQLTDENPIKLSISTAEQAEPGLYELRLFRKGAILSLSDVLPVLENAGFRVINEIVTPISSAGAVTSAIYRFDVRLKRGQGVPLAAYNEEVISGLSLILSGAVDNDRFNSLLVDPGLSCKEIALIRTLVKYLVQIKAFISLRELIDTVIENPTVTKTVVEFWRAKFDPEFDTEKLKRETRIADLNRDFSNGLKKVTSLTADRILRALWNVVDAAVRTNYYQTDIDYRIAIKLISNKVRDIPKPVPFAEIFVSSPRFDGIHLRGSKVSRGGLRWSDRQFDFRTEVLGLMKTQMVKNSIIVPGGAKGGFVLLKRPEDPNALKAEVEACYRLFVRSLLEITDNRIGDKIVHPNRTVIYDTPDPYLVVAADRGTATFSDVANSIAVNDFGFWLGDAFASGGSNGYDHKKFGITARGAWEAVDRHFREIGIDTKTTPVTVVGIGDLAGDVFGNGLIHSERLKLIAAFNHKHIFVDPNPDPERSFFERKRLFELAGSQWSDYSSSVLSPGGAVYERSQKEITISEAAQVALGINQSTVSPNELIRAILKSPVDMIWNGGIGTFIKGMAEDNISVGDRANDEIRINATELRAKIFAEGGNLGLTQLARIEYSKIGGHINVDAVDNSGGVNLSDLEVNLKIALQPAFGRGDLSFEERNKLIASCASEMCEKVLHNNSSQSRCISLAVRDSRKNLDEYASLINDLERRGVLDVEHAYLPNEDGIRKLVELRSGLTRPELAVLLGHAKIALFDEIIASTLPEYPYSRRFLLEYFPQQVREQFKDDILSHPLRREIIASQLTNLLVDRMGMTFVYKMVVESGADSSSIVFSFIVADALVNGGDLFRALEEFDTAHNNKIFLSAINRVTFAIESIAKWVLEHKDPRATISEILTQYNDPFQKLLETCDNFGDRTEAGRHGDAVKQLVLNGMPQQLAERIITVGYGPSCLDITTIALRTHQDAASVADVYFAVSQKLNIRSLLEKIRAYESTSRWDALALRTLDGDIRRTVGKLVEVIIVELKSASVGATVDFFEKHKSALEKFEKTVRDIDSSEDSISGLLVLSNQLQALAQNNQN